MGGTYVATSSNVESTKRPANFFQFGGWPFLVGSVYSVAPEPPTRCLRVLPQKSVK